MNNTADRMSKLKKQKQRTGFTLVELLVVIAIIGILASMLMPAINSARESARSAQCGSNVRNLAVAANSYAQQNKDTLPPIGTGSGSGFVALMPYLEMTNLYDNIMGQAGGAGDTDTTDTDTTGADTAGGGTTVTGVGVVPIFVCPSALNPNKTSQSNFAHCAGREGDGDDKIKTAPTQAERGAFHPSESTGIATMARDGLMNTIFYSEKRENGDVAGIDVQGGAFHAGRTPNTTGTDGTIDTSSQFHAHSNHPGGVNAAFGDAHVGFYNTSVSLTHWQGLSTASGGESEFAGSE